MRELLSEPVYRHLQRDPTWEVERHTTWLIQRDSKALEEYLKKVL
jgi:hypothetical protein